MARQLALSMICVLALDASAQNSTSAPATPELNPVVKGAVRAGVKVCLQQLNAVSEFLIAGSPNGAFVTQHATRPEQSLFSATLERTDPLGAHLITIAMAPAPGGGCSISYDHVTTWKETCEQVALGPFRDFKRRGALHRDVLQLERESLLHVSLLPAAAGCVSLKREVMYFGG